MHLKNGTYKQFVTHFERDLELKGWGANDELQVDTVSQYATDANAAKLKPTGHDRKKPGRNRN